MPKSFIETARDETLRVIELQINLLEELLAEPGLLAELDGQAKEGVLSRQRSEQWIETLRREHGKVDGLEMTIAVPHEKAALFVVLGALGKLEKLGRESENYLGLRASSLTQNAQTLEKAIRQLETDIAQLATVRDKFLSESSRFLTSLDDDIAAIQKQQKAEAKRLESGVFYAVKEQEIARGADKARLGKRLGDIHNRITIEYREKNEYEATLRTIQGAVKDMISAIVASFDNRVSAIAVELDKRLSALVQQDLQKVLDEAHATLGGAGITVQIEVPSIHAGKAVKNFTAEVYTVGAENKKTVHRRRIKNNERDGFLNWINKDWSRETYESIETVYSIDFAKVHVEIQASANEALDACREAVETKLAARVQKESMAQFDAVAKYLDRYRQALIEGKLAQLRQTREESDRLARTADNLRNESVQQNNAIQVAVEAIGRLAEADVTEVCA